jgi:thiol-disulfide isomerase/thioredoxin
MQIVNDTVNYIENLPKIKKIILLIMVVIVVIFILDIIRTFLSQSNKQTFVPNTNIAKKTSNKIEKMDPDVVNQSKDVNSQLTIGDLTIDTNKVNVTLFYADWCGHCKQFMSSTWNKFGEHYSTVDTLKLNKIDCTNTKSEIKTPAGKTIQGFPTVIINYKNADGEYIEEEYNGGRSYEVFSKYIEGIGKN